MFVDICNNIRKYSGINVNLVQISITLAQHVHPKCACDIKKLLHQLLSQINEYFFNGKYIQQKFHISKACSD